MTEEALIIFVKKPEIGKVKTRLAESIGDERALAVYKKLLERTLAVTQPLAMDKFVYYSPEIVHDDLWNEDLYFKAQQADGDLGNKMQTAFEERFAVGYRRVCIIGSDCYELSTQIIEQAFAELKQHDTVIGPSTDGGYYLLGMHTLQEALFANKTWSSEHVLAQTVADIKQQQLSCFLLPELTDVDREEDLKTMDA
jgi:rSAM/selenodomain-associated transferase 1